MKNILLLAFLLLSLSSCKNLIPFTDDLRSDNGWGDKELKQALVDEAVMRVCEKFLHYYKEGGSAANLIITMIYSTMTNKIVGLKWKDKYGHKIKCRVVCIENGEKLTRLVRYVKDDNISKKL